MDVVTADRIVSRLYSNITRKTGSRINFGRQANSKICKIAGFKVKVDLDCELFESVLTFEQARNEFTKDSKFRKIAVDPFKNGQDLPAPDTTELFLCSCVKRSKRLSGITKKGHWFHVKGFGKIFLAELLINTASAPSP